MAEFSLPGVTTNRGEELFDDSRSLGVRQSSFIRVALFGKMAMPYTGSCTPVQRSCLLRLAQAAAPCCGFLCADSSGLKDLVLRPARLLILYEKSVTKAGFFRGLLMTITFKRL